MAIQNRRGVYNDFDKTKMVEGEFAIVLDGDPEATNGQAAYISFQNGTAKRLATAEDVASDVDAATQDIQATLTENISDFIEGAQEDVDGMLGTVNTAVADANTRVAALEQDVADEIQSAQESVAGIQTDYQGLKTDNANQLYNMNQSVNDAINSISGAAQQATEAASYATAQADEVRRIIEEGGTVATVFGRSGAVEAEAGDYSSAMITHGTGSVSDALAGKQNTLIAGTGINITGQVISWDSSVGQVDPTNMYYGGTISAQGQGVLCSASGTSFTAITTGSTFNQTYPLLYASENIATMTTDTGDELGIYMLYATADNPVASADQAQYSPVYLVGTASGNTFTVDSTTAYTHTKPATSDGKEYLLLGWTGQDATEFVFDPTPNQDLSGMIVAQTPSGSITPNIKELADKTTGDAVHPVTTADAVYTDNNTTVESELEDLKKSTAAIASIGISNNNIDMFAEEEVFGTYWLNCGASDITGTKPQASGQGLLFHYRQNVDSATRMVYLAITEGTSQVRYYNYTNQAWSAWSELAYGINGTATATDITISNQNLYRQGKIVTFDIVGTATTDWAVGSSGNGRVVLPTGFRPNHIVIMNGLSGTTPIVFSVDSGGRIQTSTKITSGTAFRISGTFKQAY